MKRLMLILPLVLGFQGCSKPDDSRIYFVAKNTPGANIHSITLNKDIRRHTHNAGGRDTDITMDLSGNLFFTSNRVLPEDRAARSQLGKQASRRQDMNAVYLPAGQLEDGKDHLIQPIAKTSMPESLAAISLDGQQFSFVRTILPEGSEKTPIGQVKKEAYDELYVQAGLKGQAKKIHQSDVIVRPNWSHDSKKLVFSTYEFKKNRAALYVYDVDADSVSLMLESPWGKNQIDSPQWSPNGEKISLILHPLERNTLRTLYVLDMKSKKLDKLSDPLHSVQIPIAWNPNSETLAYGAYVDKGDFNVMSLRPRGEVSAHIFLVDFKSSPKQLTPEEKGVFLKPEFSPDGQRIAFTKANAFRSRKASLYTMNVNGEVLGELYDNVFRKAPLIWR